MIRVTEPEAYTAAKADRREKIRDATIARDAVRPRALPRSTREVQGPKQKNLVQAPGGAPSSQILKTSDLDAGEIARSLSATFKVEDRKRTAVDRTLT